MTNKPEIAYDHSFNGSASSGSASSGSAGAGQPAVQAPLRVLLLRPAVANAVADSSSASEDAPQVAQPLQQMLSDGGHRVNIVAPGADSTALAEMTPDVVLIDGADSLETTTEMCRWAASEPALKNVCSVAVFSAALLQRDGSRIWNVVRDAAQGVLNADSGALELEVHLHTWARCTRLSRELEAAREQLARQLHFDDLTQLLSRRFFFQAAHRECSRARRYNHPVACLMIDVDYLALYNTTYGYECGDYILRTVAGVLRQWTRDSDLVARFADTKLVALLPETEIGGAVGLREKLQRVVSEMEFSWHGEKLPVSLSIGEAERRPDVPRLTEDEGSDAADHAADDNGEGGETVSVREELADLLADADSALFVAKKGARYPAVFVEYTPSPSQE